MDSKPKLYYFDGYGRGEYIRMLLAYLKIDYDEAHYDFPLSEEDKKLGEWQALPMLSIDGYKLSESRSILRYLCAKNGLHPT